MSENEELENEEFDNTVVLTDDEGNEKEYAIIDVVNTDNKEYVILLPLEDEDEDEDSDTVEILRIEGEGDDETWVGLDSEEEVQKVFNLFKKQSGDKFDFED